MRILLVVAPALWFAGTAVAQSDGRPDPRGPKVKVPPVEYRSAFEGYRPYAEPEPRDWRRSNEEVGAAGAHAGHRPRQGEGAQTSKPAPAHEGHGGHK
jgi:hypothetical protein